MSSSSSRPVYVPRNKRRRPERFHGAFTGGFSAGYFNTVGTKEGWQPSDETPSQQQQRPEDFMDEQDHNEWGGPQAVRQEYQVSSSAKPQAPTEELFLLPPDHVGRRLLRLLGWRDGSTAYVPQQDTQQQHDLKDEQEIMLSQRRIRKIQLQQQRVQIPQPKLDTTGLGFEPYKDAPEFQAHQERRRTLAQQRAHASSNVYRVNDVLGNLHDGDDEDADDSKTRRGDTTTTKDPYISYETVEDFVGTKSVGGFALREDEDDAYDDEPRTHISDKVRLDRESYETVAYEHHESDDDEAAVHAQNKAEEVNFGGLLSSWATSNKDRVSDQTVSVGVTADGRPPLPGFLLGGSSSTPSQRFRGPDLPDNYRIQKHVFDSDEHPLVLKAVSRAVQLEVDDARKKAAVEDALQSNAATNAPSRIHPRSDKAIAGVAFAGLAEAMKSRFTSQRSEETQSEPSRSAGLSLPQPKEDTTQQSPVAPNEAVENERVFKITRSVASFAPTPLLCKRFGVSALRQSMAIESSDNRRKEEAYFQDKILKIAAESDSLAKTAKQESSAGERTVQPKDTLATQSEEEPLQRPSMATYKSIYEPDSESSAGEDEGDSGVGSADRNEKEVASESADDKPKKANVTVQSVVEVTAEDSVQVPDASRESVEPEDQHRRQRKRSRSAESSSLSKESRRRRKKDDQRSKRRKDDRRKKKKRKKKSLKRKSD